VTASGLPRITLFDWRERRPDLVSNEQFSAQRFFQTVSIGRADIQRQDSSLVK
jgi:hypothetical protein